MTTTFVLDIESIDLDCLDDLDALNLKDCEKYFKTIYSSLLHPTLSDGSTNTSDTSATSDVSETSIEESKHICSNCGSTDLIEDSSNGIILCGCGQVKGELFDYRTESRIYDDDGKAENTRCNKITNVLLPQSSLGTRLPYNIRGSLQKLQTWSAMPYRERSLYNDFKKIAEKCEKLSLKKNIQETANIFYAAAKSCKYQEGANQNKFIITRGKNNRGIQSGCIWISCKANSHPIIAKDIAAIYELTIKELNKGVKTLLKHLHMKEFNINIETMKSESYVKKYCLELNVKTEYMNEAINIAYNINRLNLASEHTQFSIAATSVLIMAENNNINTMTKKRLRKMFGVSEVTISKTYNKIKNIKHILNNNEAVDKVLIKIKSNESEPDEEIPPEILLRMKKFNIGVKTTTDRPSIISSEPEVKIKIKTSKSSNASKASNASNKTSNKIKV
jgi:transcription initiation factor TFIIIB Brf1 subunit/transcription initiation factor TFIIB